MSDDETTAASVDEMLDDEDGTIDDELFDGDVATDDEDEIFGEDDDALGDDALGDDALDDDEADEDEDESDATVPLDASEDGDDEFDGQPAVDLAVIEGLEVDDPTELVEDEVEDQDTDDTIREGEFVCSSCHMAKRSSALADADEMLCRDCV